MCGSPLGTCPEDVHVLSEVQRPAQCNGADHGDQRAGDLLGDLLRAHDDRQHSNRDRQGVEVDLLELLQVGPDLAQGAVPSPLESEHAGDLPERNLHADPGQESDQHGARKKVRQEPQSDDPRQDQEPRRHEGENRGEGHVLIGAHRGDAHQARGEDGRRRRVRPHHQVPRGAEDGEQGHGDQNGVEARDHRRAGDLGVAHHLGDGERRQCDAGDDLGRDLRCLDGQHALKDRKPPSD